MANSVSDSGSRMLSALLVTKAIPRRIHMLPSVMMNGCTRSPTTITPLSAPAPMPTTTQTTRASSTVARPPPPGVPRTTSPIVTPASA